MRKKWAGAMGMGGLRGNGCEKGLFFGWNFGFFGSAGVDLCGYGISGEFLGRP
jgi:hypothetical protein